MERDPVVGLSVYAAHVGWNRNLGPGVGHFVPLGARIGVPAHEFECCPVADLVAGCSTQIDHSGQADYSGDLDYGPGTGRAGGQLGPAGGSGSEMAAGAVAEGHHPVSIYVFERG